MNTCELQSKLERLTTSQMNALAEKADVSLRALWRIRAGHTKTASEPLKAAVMQFIPKMLRKNKE